jgi:ADA HAT complex component 1
MQSIFRLPALPWSPGALDKSTVFHQPIVDMGAVNNKAKRKRATDTSSSSPRSSPKPLPKKIKSAEVQVTTGGAVQSVVDQIHVRFGADGVQPGESQTAVSSGAGVNKLPPHSHVASTVAQASIHPGVSSVASSFTTSGVTALLGKSQQVTSTLPPSPASTSDQVMAPEPLTTQSMVPGSTITTTSILTTTPSPPQDLKYIPSVIPRQAMKVDKSVLRAIIEAEINQAILFKHNELRLIDQEMAKCQVALEQLRRCSITPMQTQNPALASHSGPALVAPPGYSVPDSPAPWGITDGPYSRHYATWLLQSPRFDPQSPEALAAATALNSPLPMRDGRVTRGSGVEVSTPIHPISARPSRTITGRVRSLHDPASPLAGRDPLVLKRQKDGQWVKLYCTSCNPERSDFANVQGFLNHCRISHKLDFKSHEAAAIECGRPVEVNEYFPPMEPTSAREPPMRPQFSSSFTFSIDKPNVHPLNKVATKNRDLSTPQQILPRSYSMSAAVPRIAPLTPVASPGFVPSSDTPYLSTMLGKRGFSSSLSSMVTEAKRKVDLSEYDVESEPDCDAEPKTSKGKKKGSSTKASTASGHFKSNSKPSSRPVTTGGHRLAPASIVHMRPVPLAPIARDSPDTTDGDIELSPNTADSNPGLVSDRDDEEDEDETDEMHHSSRKDGMHDDMIVAIEDSDNEGRHVEETQGFCSNQPA